MTFQIFFSVGGNSTLMNLVRLMYTATFTRYLKESERKMTNFSVAYLVNPSAGFQCGQCKIPVNVISFRVMSQDMRNSIPASNQVTERKSMNDNVRVINVVRTLYKQF